MVMKNDREEEVSLEESCCVWLVRGEAGVIMQRLSFSGFSGLPKHWERETTPGGREYYVHKLTGWATYQKPQPLPCLLYTSPSPRDRTRSRMPSSA